jgi:predicted Rossmann fold nucleotide-binding protein DprA/Smf involved in DNA uptake
MKPIVGIIGSRSITTLNLDLFIDKTHVGEIVSGGANGTDKIAEN